ncbi:hypothetical protein C8Q74DRAFT_1219018 [Fomes fomentarius]|nr:hypothetical protein C8Q74DRAFT_1219018 [Fomes fomentarius]
MFRVLLHHIIEFQVVTGPMGNSDMIVPERLERLYNSSEQAKGPVNGPVPLPVSRNTDILDNDVSQNLAVVVEFRHDRDIIITFLCADRANASHSLAAQPLLVTTASCGQEAAHTYYHVPLGLARRTNALEPTQQHLTDVRNFGQFKVPGRPTRGTPRLDVYALTPPQASRDPQCTFRLTRAKAGQSRAIHLQPTKPVRRKDMSAPFIRDPDSIAVVIQLIVRLDAKGDSELERNLKWDEWGAEGSVFLNIPRKPSASSSWFMPIVWAELYGSRVSLLFCDKADSEMRECCAPRIVLLDWQRPSRVVTTHDEIAVVPWRMSMTNMSVPTSATMGYRQSSLVYNLENANRGVAESYHSTMHCNIPILSRASFGNKLVSIDVESPSGECINPVIVQLWQLAWLTGRRPLLGSCWTLFLASTLTIPNAFSSMHLTADAPHLTPQSPSILTASESSSLSGRTLSRQSSVSEGSDERLCWLPSNTMYKLEDLWFQVVQADGLPSAKGLSHYPQETNPQT